MTVIILIESKCMTVVIVIRFGSKDIDMYQCTVDLLAKVKTCASGGDDGRPRETTRDHAKTIAFTCIIISAH